MVHEKGRVKESEGGRKGGLVDDEEESRRWDGFEVGV
jgi:hypothetical protein